MSELTVIENLQAEKTNLELHVDLCAERYGQLIRKFDEVDSRLDQLTQMVSDIKESVETITTSTQATYLRWAGFIIVTLLGIVIHYAVK
jgi:methyl-accepting chemotaxis protein